MAKVLLTSMDEKLVAKALAHHGKRDVCVAMDKSVLNTMKALELGLDTHALVGTLADPKNYDSCSCITPAPAKKAIVKPSKKVVEAKEDEPRTE
tara:strand:+ start:2124 stop:2405 length:282 start_codon:yes stop_codon:yes gene_type:complete